MKSFRKKFLLVGACGYLLLFGGQAMAQNLWNCRDGQVRWVSDAPLELIQAESEELQGIFRREDRSFAFSISIRSFEGFNSPLQQEHFHENYLETEAYEKATYSGRILEEIDLRQPGKYEVRAKGTLTIHGVAKERIIRATLEVRPDGELVISSSFVVPLVDHDISIPRVVFQKIAEEIRVSINATLRAQTP